ncbi:MAG TPA: hypothetical protein VKY45_05970 [Marinilabiliaceae bacterium]|nr:hypothetical protein [Marinilabiliaceae bacterium]
MNSSTKADDYFGVFHVAIKKTDYRHMKFQRAGRDGINKDADEVIF